MSSLSTAVHSDPDILGGTPVFLGTRVPLRNLIDYLEDNYTIDEFLEQFPAVTRKQVETALEAIEEAIPRARPA